MPEFFIGADEFLLAALKEDLGTGDITTLACVPDTAIASGEFVAKEPGVLCGIGIAGRVFELVDSDVKLSPLKKDGDIVEKGDIIAKISGRAQSVLSGERVALNLLQRLSGVATQTAQAVAAVCDTQARIVDTRKTTPGMRVFEKYAVRCGGGSNHRFNLADGILIKDNHIVAAGGICQAVSLARAQAPHTLKIEVETETLPQVEEAISAGADIIMLDNMTYALMREAVTLISGRALTEASGNMGEKDLSEVAKAGVNFISIGALTHSVKALDISLKFR